MCVGYLCVCVVGGGLGDHTPKYKMLTLLGTSLVVQWLGLPVFTAVAWVQSLVGELRSHKPRHMAKKIK